MVNFFWDWFVSSHFIRKCVTPLSGQTYDSPFNLEILAFKADLFSKKNSDYLFFGLIKNCKYPSSK